MGYDAYISEQVEAYVDRLAQATYQHKPIAKKRFARRPKKREQKALIRHKKKSETLSRWHVVSYPDNCQCQKCSSTNKPIKTPPESPQKKTPIPRSRAVSQQYYRAALKLGQFSIQNIRAEGLPNPDRAANYLADLVKSGKLIRTGKAQYAVKPK
jgi:hypothetical protein